MQYWHLFKAVVSAIVWWMMASQHRGCSANSKVSAEPKDFLGWEKKKQEEEDANLGWFSLGPFSIGTIVGYGMYRIAHRGGRRPTTPAYFLFPLEPMGTLDISPDT